MNNNQTTYVPEYRDPASLHVHPELRALPELSEEELKHVRAGMQRAGLNQPLLIDDKNRILDDHSRTLWVCAKAWALKSVLVTVRATEDVHILIIQGLAHRRHLTKSAIAYLAVPHLQPAFEAAHRKHLESLRKGQQIPVVSSETTGVKSGDELAEELGIGRNLLFEARKVRKAFEDKKKYSFTVAGGPKDGEVVECTLREWFEPKILRSPIGGEHEANRPLGLGGVMAGIAGLAATKDVSRQDRGQLELFTKNVLGLSYKYWSKLSEKDRGTALEHAANQAASLDEEECDGLAEMHMALAKVYQDQAERHGGGK